MKIDPEFAAKVGTRFTTIEWYWNGIFKTFVMVFTEVEYTIEVAKQSTLNKEWQRSLDT